MSGNGGGRQPYIPRWSLYDLVPGDNSQAEVTITGTGTPGDPWVISIETLGGSIVQTIYNASDTWVKTGGTVAQVVVIGGGGGGGASASGTADSGGSGGDGGAMSVAWFAVDDLPDEVEIEVGQGGAGAPPVSGSTTGGAGGDSWFGEYLYAPGGRGGHSQAQSSQTQHTTLGGTPPDGGPGGAGAVRNGSAVVPATDHTTYLSPTGGGNGQGNVVPASSGGDIFAGRTWAGEGGQGSVWGTGTPGGDGQDYGGGGGGGQARSTGNTNGGDGAPGVVVVTVW